MAFQDKNKKQYPVVVDTEAKQRCVAGRECRSLGAELTHQASGVQGGAASGNDPECFSSFLGPFACPKQCSQGKWTGEGCLPPAASGPCPPTRDKHPRAALGLGAPVPCLFGPLMASLACFASQQSGPHTLRHWRYQWGW